jgi:flavin-dependent dehydrogenase
MRPDPDRHTAGPPAVEPTRWDAVIIGGGPAGAAAAAALSTLGHRVVVLEKSRHPRFHIGESLLPFTMDLLKRIGFAPALAQAGFTSKLGATFVLADGTRAQTFYFEDGLVPGTPGAYQVLRSRFDHLLVEHCRTCGAEAREGHRVTGVDIEGADAVVEAQAEDGSRYAVRGRYVVDASGRDALLAHRWSLKRPVESLRKVALFAHYTGALRDEGRAAGNTVSVVIRDGWIWFIPLENGTASVGVVVDGQTFKAAGLDATAYFDQVLARVPAIARRLAGAQRISPVHSTSDFSYTTSRMTGRNWLLIGDAGFFLDPIFSSGVHLAIASGISAADAIHEKLTGWRPWRRPFARYERRLRRDQRFYQSFIAGWYRPGFQDLLLSPSRRMQLVQAVTSALAGAPRTWRMFWRLRVFMLLAWINGRLPLTERLDRSRLPP